MRFPKIRKLVGGFSAVLLGVAIASTAQQGEAPQSTSGQKTADAGTGGQRGRRDPFEALIRKSGPANGQARICPAGIAGVEVASMIVDGVVSAGSGMIAVVSTPQKRVYFVREGDRLCDGSVERITMDGVVVRERGQDAFGKPVDRLVTKRLYPSAGEGR